VPDIDWSKIENPYAKKLKLGNDPDYADILRMAASAFGVAAAKKLVEESN
jgi:hypothetical protein